MKKIILGLEMVGKQLGFFTGKQVEIFVINKLDDIIENSMISFDIMKIKSALCSQGKQSNVIGK